MYINICPINVFTFVLLLQNFRWIIISKWFVLPETHLNLLVIGSPGKKQIFPVIIAHVTDTDRA